MNGSRKRLTLQLTPLLDLLLIVIFAQYMEVQQNVRSAESELGVQRQQIAAERQQLADQAAAERSVQNAELSAQKSDLEQQREEYARRFQSILDQHQQAASVLADALQLPGQLMEQLAKLRSGGAAEDADRLEAAASRVRELLKSRGEQFMQVVIRFDEMQKHVSVWEIHLQENGQAVVSDGDQSQTISFESAEGFQTRVFEASKTFGDPRTLVLVMLTHGDTQAGLRRKATDAMPSLIEQLRKDAGNTRWYDFSLLGYRPQGRYLLAVPIPTH